MSSAEQFHMSLWDWLREKSLLLWRRR